MKRPRRTELRHYTSLPIRKFVVLFMTVLSLDFHVGHAFWIPSCRSSWTRPATTSTSSTTRITLLSSKPRSTQTNQINATIQSRWDSLQQNPSQSGYDTLLADCIAQNDWHTVVQILQAAPTSVHPSTYSTCLKKCQIARNQQSGRDIWQAMRDARVTPTREDFTRMGYLLATRKSWRDALRIVEQAPAKIDQDVDISVYNNILVAMTRDGQWKAALTVLQRLEEGPGRTKPVRATLRIIMDACAQYGQPDQARLVLQKATNPTTRDYQVVILAYTKKRQWRRAVQLLDQMEQSKIPRSLRIYNAILTACSKAREFVAAQSLLVRMRKRDGIAPDILSYNAVLTVAASTRWKDALTIFDQAQREPGVTPDVYTYTNAIRACAKGGLTTRALSLLQVVKDLGLPLDQYLYTAAIEACDWRKALDLLREMEDQGIAPTEFTYSVTIKACGSGGQWKRALELLDTMRSKKMQINLYVYNAAITAVSKAAKKQQKRDNPTPLYPTIQSLLEQMRLDGIDPDGFSYSSAISCCGSEGRWKEALQLIETMEKGGPKTRPNKVAYTAAIVSCGRAGKVQEAMNLFEIMNDSGITADLVTYNALFSALRIAKRPNEAFDLWQEMLGRSAGARQDSGKKRFTAMVPVKPDIITLTDAIGAMSSSDDNSDELTMRRIDGVFTEAVRLQIVLPQDTLDSVAEYDLSGMSLPVARAACRFIVHQLRRTSEVPETVTFITGVGTCHRSEEKQTTSLRDFVQEVLREDFVPAIASTIPKLAQGTVEMNRDGLLTSR